MTRAPFNVRKHAVAVHNVTQPAQAVELRRRYVDARWRPEAFGEPVRREDTERYFMERGELQGGLFG
jgi:hypothetical protein